MKKIEELYRQKKIRKDAVKHIDGMITSDNEFLVIRHSKYKIFEQLKNFRTRIRKR